MAAKETAFEGSDAQGPKAIEEGIRALSTGMPSSTMYASAEDLGHELMALLDERRYRDRRIHRPKV